MGTTRQAAERHSILTRALVALIDVYRWLLSPMIGQHCRFHPTCSRYAREALIGHGAIKGSWLAARRIARCHPWSPGGIDEVPTTLPESRL